MRVLTGDIGGTKTDIALVEVDGPKMKVVTRERYPSRSFAGLSLILRAFLEKHPERGERACFAVAGPVDDGVSQTTNLPWTINGAELARDLGLGPTRLINDFEAIAYGVLGLDDDEAISLHDAPRDPRGAIAIVGAGTGLGEAFLFWNGKRHAAVASEGGHRDFAPVGELQEGLLAHLRARHGHVSCERVISGSALAEIYAYLRDRSVAPETAAVRDAIGRGEDVGALLGRHAIERSCPLAVATMRLFAAAYGAEAGNLALQVVARGGVYVAGGIAPKIVPLLNDGVFRAAYLDKGRFKSLLEGIPVRLVTSPHVSLYGAALGSLD